ncbi:uncharacterized protein LOC131313226 isoform X1 [Rhododendron vialii]|uniref:uncharacterized protein LOC131313226 isoform X1 n=2 Tax=Rhododendron vialii TaxID=182163 RepID=UPI00265FC131|nr:uncharacterized protein LOC131313226 isoform X1 [Rhododendron vialii]
MGRSPFDEANGSSYSSSQPPIPQSSRNVFSLLAQREVSPRTKCLPRRNWGIATTRNAEFSLGSRPEATRDAKRDLLSWVEAESLRHLSAKYCPLMPPPRSTIAAAFSPDGKTLASTHGDHTVKIIHCQSGSCLKVLSGHRRTPWVVRFHPEHPEILASGSLDHEVRLWNAHTSECIGSLDFYRPIASLAFHAEGEVLAVASGHKLYIWHYDRRGETSSPTVVLKTKRSLRAVHFHPHGAPFLLTAEVNDLGSSDSSMIMATSPGSWRYPPPAVYVANVQSTDRFSMSTELPLMSLPLLFLPSFPREDSRTDPQLGNRPVGPSHVGVGSSSSMQFQGDVNAIEQPDHMDLAPESSSNSHSAIRGTLTKYCPTGLQDSVADTTMDSMETTEQQLDEGYQQSLISEAGGVPRSTGFQVDRVSVESRQHQFLHYGDSTRWELPFLQGWLMGQSQASMAPVLPVEGGMPMAPVAMPSSVNRNVVSGGSGLRDLSLQTHLMSALDSRQGAAHVSNSHGRSDSIPILSRIQSELAASLAATAPAELPCTVKLRIWPHDIKSPHDPLDAERCRLTIPHAVLCSEMGAHFSPCGRFLAACVACVLPQIETDPGLLTQLHQDFSGAGTSPTRHPISARQVLYELRIYSLEEATFGVVLVSRPIRAAHCLTSIQFSPTSEHILLAYGRRHSSLLKSIVINGETSLPVYTVLEVYRVSDMELVSILPSAEDEVNVACFHPLAGGGLVYGTKEGKLRVFQYDGSHDKSCTGTNFFSEDSFDEVEQYPRFRHML